MFSRDKVWGSLCLLTLILCVVQMTQASSVKRGHQRKQESVSESESKAGKDIHFLILNKMNELQKTWYRDAMQWWTWKNKTEKIMKTELKILKKLEKNMEQQEVTTGRSGGGDRDRDKDRDKERDKDRDKPEGGEQKQIPPCGKHHKLKLNGSTVEITSPNFYTPLMYPDNLRCQVEVYGEEGCQPSVMCNVFDIRKVNSACNEEYLKISDGIGHSVKFCGKKGPRPHEKWISSKGARDIFFTFVTSGGQRATNGDADAGDKPEVTATTDNDGFFCTVQCLQSRDHKHYSETPVVRHLVKQEEEAFAEDRCRCGVKKNDEDRIVGGSTVERGSYPWQVAIVEKRTREPFCGGALINDRFVLTASHCFPPELDISLEKNVEVLLHAHLLEASLIDDVNDNAKQGEKGWSKSAGWDKNTVTDAEEGTLRYRVKEIILHPLYRHGKFDYDVALLRLAGRVKLTEPDSPVPVCLPVVGTYENYKGESATVVGWGLGDEKGATTTRLLQELSVPIIPLETCKEWMPKNNITKRMMCAGFENGQQDACRADSGGPLMRNFKGKYWEQIGVVSWGVGCARKKRPGFYAKVVEMNQWIHHMTSEIDVKWCSRPGTNRSS